MGLAATWTIAALAGATWGVLFVSWMLLPISVPARVLVSMVLILIMAVAGPRGRAAAGGFALGMGCVASLILAESGLVLGDAPLAPLAAVVAGAALTWWSFRSRTPSTSPPTLGGL
jgi:hypothetical protein